MDKKDLIERGRNLARADTMVSEFDPKDHLVWKMADALEAQQAKIERLQGALVRIDQTGDDGTHEQLAPDMWDACRELARAALEDTQ